MKLLIHSQNFNGCIVEVWKWISNFTPHFIMDVVNYPCWDCSRAQYDPLGGNVTWTPFYWHRLTLIPAWPNNYGDVIMGAMASQITSLTIVYSTVYSDADQRKHQSSASLAFVRGIHRGPMNSPHKWPVTRKMFPFDDVIMKCVGYPFPNFNDCFVEVWQWISTSLHWVCDYPSILRVKLNHAFDGFPTRTRRANQVWHINGSPNYRRF